MKFKQGFISNSSSTSFTCDFCGSSESGWDSSLSDCCMYQCINDHTVCYGHEIEDLDAIPEEEKQEWLEKKFKYYEYDKDKIKDLYSKYSFNELLDQFEFDYYIPTKYCPLCKMKKVTDTELLDYILKVFSKKRSKVLEEIKDKFNSDYSQFRKFLED